MNTLRYPVHEHAWSKQEPKQGTNTNLTTDNSDAVIVVSTVMIYMQAMPNNGGSGEVFPRSQ